MQSSITTWLRSIDRNQLAYWFGLLLLFAGIRLKFDLGTALIVLGSVEVVVSVATAFFVTGLSATIRPK